MMKKAFILVLLALMPLAAGFPQEKTALKLDAKEVNEITKACLDYVEGFFESDQARIENGVHQKLAKRDTRLNEMTRDQLVQAALGGKRNKPKITVRVFDISGNMASARIDSLYVDYVHVVKTNGKWQILNVLWDFMRK